MDLDTEDADYEDQDPDPTPEPEGPKGLRQKLSREANARKKAEERAEQAERRAGFLEAGIPNTPKFSYFRDGYKGEMTAEAIKAAAIEAELLPQPEPDTPDHEMEAQQRMAEASAGAETSAAALKMNTNDYQARIAAAQSAEEILKIMDEAGSPHTGTAY